MRPSHSSRSIHRQLKCKPVSKQNSRIYSATAATESLIRLQCISLSLIRYIDIDIDTDIDIDMDMDIDTDIDRQRQRRRHRHRQIET